MTLLAASPALLRLSEEAEEAAKLWGLPIWVWQFLNLALFLGVLLYFIAKPLATAFRQRQEEIERRRLEAEKRRESVDRLAADIRERASRIEREIEEIRRQGKADGEEARRSLGERAIAEAERIREQAVEEVERRFAAARAQLRQQAAELTTDAAGKILSREITPADRERLLADGVSRLKDAP
ncbi:MAG TPA: ATP synthase F0 subunit B [Thermoanaerobaculia bacterium]|nr:ATP synthase F0 subunit B [Thermoanaerobaculia bacterium]